jgi:hypothetical protein
VSIDNADVGVVFSGLHKTYLESPIRTVDLPDLSAAVGYAAIFDTRGLRSLLQRATD